MLVKIEKSSLLPNKVEINPNSIFSLYKMQEEMESTIGIRSRKDYSCLKNSGMSFRFSLILFLLRSQGLNGLIFSLFIDSIDLMFTCSSEKP